MIICSEFVYNALMLTRLLGILATFIIMVVSIQEAQEFAYSKDIHEHSVSDHLELNNLYGEMLDRENCDDCDDGCSDAGNCCQGFCKCSSPLYTSLRHTVSCINEILFSKVIWYFHDEYHSPFLDPARKPPLFS